MNKHILDSLKQNKLRAGSDKDAVPSGLSLILISDTHLIKQEQFNDELIALSEKYPESILIHAGDGCNTGSYDNAKSFLKWMEKLPFKTKLFIPGNHDVAFDKYFRSSSDYVKTPFKFVSKNTMEKYAPSVTLLINDIVEINGVNFGGSCVIPDYPMWGFYKNPESSERFWDNFPKVDILINHAPFEAYFKNGCTYKGDPYLKDYLIRNNIKTFICGHIHELYGISNIDGINVYHASLLDKHYEPTNKPLVLEINGNLNEKS